MIASSVNCKRKTDCDQQFIYAGALSRMGLVSPHDAAYAPTALPAREQMDREVRGYMEQLDDTRVVFVGQREDEPDTFYLGFRSADGVDTKLKVSSEAMAALIRLRLALHGSKDAKQDFPHGPTWKHHWVVQEVEFD
jgi:hypothetical protein